MRKLTDDRYRPDEKVIQQMEKELVEVLHRNLTVCVNNVAHKVKKGDAAENALAYNTISEVVVGISAKIIGIISAELGRTLHIVDRRQFMEFFIKVVLPGVVITVQEAFDKTIDTEFVEIMKGLDGQKNP